MNQEEKELEKAKERARRDLKQKGLSYFRTSVSYPLRRVKGGLHAVHEKTNEHTFLFIKKTDDGREFLDIETYTPTQ